MNGQVTPLSSAKMQWKPAYTNVSEIVYADRTVTLFCRFQTHCALHSRSLCEEQLCKYALTLPPSLILQILHTISNEQLELVNSMAPYMEKTVMPILKETKSLWQPSDFLPESSSETFIDEVALFNSWQTTVWTGLDNPCYPYALHYAYYND